MDVNCPNERTFLLTKVDREIGRQLWAMSTESSCRLVQLVGVTTAEANLSGPLSPRNWRRGQELTGGRCTVAVLQPHQLF